MTISSQSLLRQPCKAQHRQLLGCPVRAWLCYTGLLSAFLLGAQNGLAESGDRPAESGSVPFQQIIDRILINNEDVFDLSDPKEDKLLFRFANKVHINTKENVIRDLVLFKSGDVLSMRILAESERILRAQIHIKDARIVLVNVRPDKVDVQITTKDTWTLTPGGSFSREGGENSSSVSLEESNLLGYGKAISLRKSKDSERSEEKFRYKDPNLSGSRHVLEMDYSNNSDGRTASFDFKLPFYSFAAPRSYGVRLKVDKKFDQFLNDAGEVFRVEHHDDFYESFFGFSYKVTDTRSIRLTFGYTYESHNFESGDLLQSTGQEHDDTESYVWIGSEYIEDSFIKLRRINFIARTEDINLGHSARTRIGWSDTGFGADADGALLRGEFGYNAIVGQGRVLSNYFNLDARVEDKRLAKATVNIDTRLYHRYREDITNYMRVRLDLGRELNIEEEFELGGDSGLRGYPLKLQSGNKRVLLTFEQRYYTDWHWLQLARVGGVLFADIGRAWTPGDPYAGNQGVMKDIGFGLRLVSSRASRDTVIHADVAIPLDGNLDDDYQWVVKSSSTF